MSKPCGNCGRILSSRAMFCSYCGMKIKEMNTSEFKNFQQKIRINKNISPSRRAKITAEKVGESAKMRSTNSNNGMRKAIWITIGSLSGIGIIMFVCWMMMKHRDSSVGGCCDWNPFNKHHKEYIDF
ncbi:MAG: hypothetical protein WCI30_08045 [Clostridia bacterium]